jgi:hypothetical protein
MIFQPRERPSPARENAFRDAIDNAVELMRRRSNKSQMRLWDEAPAEALRTFWQRRFYDFNV